MSTPTSRINAIGPENFKRISKVVLKEFSHNNHELFTPSMLYRHLKSRLTCDIAVFFRVMIILRLQHKVFFQKIGTRWYYWGGKK